jgi:V/A-type H+-transporting ATPase subunit C
MLLRVKKQGRTTNFLSTLIAEGGDIETEALLSWNKESRERITSFLLDTRYRNIIEESIDRTSGVIDPIIFNHLADDALMEVIREGMYTSEGPEPILAYFYALETEVQNLRLVFSGEINNLDSSDVRERLRELYVS